MKTIYKYDEVYVVIRYGDTEFYHIYTDKDQCQQIVDENNESMTKLTFYDPKSPIWEVKTLWEAVDWVKEALNDQFEFDKYNEQS